eukprot:IDg6933t1
MATRATTSGVVVPLTTRGRSTRARGGSCMTLATPQPDVSARMGAIVWERIRCAPGWRGAGADRQLQLRYVTLCGEERGACGGFFIYCAQFDATGDPFPGALGEREQKSAVDTPSWARLQIACEAAFKGKDWQRESRCGSVVGCPGKL